MRVFYNFGSLGYYAHWFADNVVPQAASLLMCSIRLRRGDQIASYFQAMDIRTAMGCIRQIGQLVMQINDSTSLANKIAIGAPIGE